MKINKNRPGYITVQGQRIRTTGREISLHEVVNDDGQKGVALRLNGKDVEIHKLTIQEYTFLMSAVNFMVIDVLTPLMLVQGAMQQLSMIAMLFIVKTAGYKRKSTTLKLKQFRRGIRRWVSGQQRQK